MKLETCRVDTDFRSSHVVPCVVLIAKSPWDGVSSTALAFPCCHHGVRSRHSRHEGAARAAGWLVPPLTFFFSPASFFDVPPRPTATPFFRGPLNTGLHLLLSLCGLLLVHSPPRGPPPPR